MKKPHSDSKCGVCATPQFERNNYFYGKQFTVRDLVQEQSYFNEKRHLINRMILGWGVVCGLNVYLSSDKRGIVVEPGMALDCCGREIVVCEKKVLSFNKDDEDCCFQEDQRPEGKFVLCLEYDECYSEPIDLPPAGCDEKGKKEHNRIRETFKLQLKPWDEACPREPRDEVECPDRHKHDAKDDSYSRDCTTPNVHAYLCERLRHCPECKNCDCVILATITFPSGPPRYGDPYGGPQKPGEYNDPAQGGSYNDPKQSGGYNDPRQSGGYNDPSQSGGYNDPRQGGGYKDPKQGGYGDYQPPDLDSCTNRKFVYKNSLLYDLIHCYHGDLPHIVDFSWRTADYAKREIEFEAFLQMIKDGLKVYFDQPMSDYSLSPHTFFVSYLYRETGTGVYVRKQIPVREVTHDQEGDCYTATLHAREDWIKEELDSPNSELLADTRYEPGVVVEIVLRGSRIWSKSGKALDGEFLADKLPTGNGTQGGDFIDWLRVMPREKKKGPGKSYADEF